MRPVLLIALVWFLSDVIRPLLELLVLFSLANKGEDQDHNCRDNLDEPGKNGKDLVDHVHCLLFEWSAPNFGLLKTRTV